MLNYWTNKRVVITGGGGFVGRHLVLALSEYDCYPTIIRSRAYDLRREEMVSEVFRDVGHIDVIFHLAANVGGIGANAAHPARMYSDNVKMDTHLIEYATAYSVGCFVGMGSVCAYPKHAPVPFKEETLWDGYPEETNAAYGLAKRGMLACLMAHGQEHGLNWRYALSSNLYGPGDNVKESGHVVAALIRRFSEAVSEEFIPTLWGTGRATRDFLYVGDVVRGLIALAEHGKCEPVNLGSGIETSIESTAKVVADACGYRGSILWDWDTALDGQPRRVLDISKALALGWKPETSLEDGILNTLHAYQGAVHA